MTKDEAIQVFENLANLISSTGAYSSADRAKASEALAVLKNGKKEKTEKKVATKDELLAAAE